MLGLARQTPSWQLILADLALILFLMTAAALSAYRETDTNKTSVNAPAPLDVALGPAQAVYRPGPGLPTFSQWLESQPRDSRASLTIVSEYTGNDDDAAWSDARGMAEAAQAIGVRARVIIREGEKNTVQANLAYDQPEL